MLQIDVLKFLKTYYKDFFNEFARSLITFYKKINKNSK